ncbi:MAG: hypothetical protein Q7U60_10760 [Candidatus Methanoperedens sp.]|nr:hypothetical protein [Candidatus Methanoperedens sp.]
MEVDGKVMDGLNAVPLFGNNPKFQDAPSGNIIVNIKVTVT